jgi:hypothetical protein
MNERSAAAVHEGLDRIRPTIRDLSVIAPVAFAQEADGTVPLAATVDLMPFRMFCSYNRLRLMPVVALDYFSDIPPDRLLKIIRTNRLNGLILLVRTMPKEKWFTEMASLIEETSSALIVISSPDPVWTTGTVKTPEAARAELERFRKTEMMDVREIQRGSVIFHPSKKDWVTKAKPFSSWCATADLPSVREDFHPTVVVLTKGFQMLPNDEPPASAGAASGKKPAPDKPVQVYLPGEKPEEEEQPAEEEEEAEEEEVPPIGDPPPPPAPATNAVPSKASATNAVPAEASSTNAPGGAKGLLDQMKRLFHSFATSAMEAVSGPTAPSETLKTSDPATK